MLSRSHLKEQLHAEQCSCVVANVAGVTMFHQRGVKDLYSLLGDEAEPLRGALVADKVVGKGAAALMVAGGVEWVWADVVSEGALELFERYGVEVEYGERVAHIINRAGDGMCPVERLCATFSSAEECLPAIDKFVKGIL